MWKVENLNQPRVEFLQNGSPKFSELNERLENKNDKPFYYLVIES